MLCIAAVSGAVAVALGAFGAHGLETLIEKGEIDNARIETWNTAVQYHFYHTFALCVLAFATPHLSKKWMRNSKVAFLSGICIFSGSLYLLTLSPLFGSSEWSWLGAVTPLGGLAFIAGWIFLFLAAKKSSE